MINVNKLSFAYGRKSNLFDNMSFSLPVGSITGLLGRNGEGKTTLLKLISAQLLASRSQINVCGYDPYNRDIDFLSQVYYLPEEVKCPNITIRKYFNIITPFYPSYCPEVAEDLIQNFKLDWNMKLGRVSQGQKKKAVIALALSLRVPVLLMDEPTNGLDIPSKSAFRKLMARYITDEQIVIISTHQVRDLEQLIDRILMMDENSIICNESIGRLSNLFSFKQTHAGEAMQPLYTESSILGNVGVYENKVEDETPFSMELFFNGMIANREKFLRIINNYEIQK
ncbi:ABC transporter ATP-binding protein [Porphyromonas pogonae]|uniref:ABC transporter ATP-binding protein n=1 Tax=Porphyromonas pogonae TaxID=867595 RepID=UPI002E79EE43|nr:ABC transporter ATP-binding protein [Porphyromonas pogonae]